MSARERDPVASLRLHDRRVIYYNPGRWNWVSSDRDHHNLWIALRGRGTMQIDGRMFMIRPGFAVLLCPRMRLCAESRPASEVHNIGLHLWCPPRRAAALAQAARGAVEVRSLALLHELASHLDELGASPGADPRELDGIARLMVRVFLRELRAPREDLVARCIRRQADAVRREPGRDWRIDVLAREAGVSVSQYNRRFRQLMHASPNAFVIDRRIESARILLRDGTLPLEEIARLLGYRSGAFFSRQFKQKCGCPPLRHRMPKGAWQSP